MSRVTTLILTTSCMEGDSRPETIRDVNSYFYGIGKSGLVGVDDPSLPPHWYGGDKHVEANIYVGAFNYLDMASFIDHLKTLSWRNPESLQLFVLGEDDSEFRVIEPFSNKESGSAVACPPT